MYILSLVGHEGEGAYAVTNDDGQKGFISFSKKMTLQDMQVSLRSGRIYGIDSCGNR